MDSPWSTAWWGGLCVSTRGNQRHPSSKPTGPSELLHVTRKTDKFSESVARARPVHSFSSVDVRPLFLLLNTWALFMNRPLLMTL